MGLEQEHNYLTKIRKMHEAGRFPAGIVDVDVLHDDWCGIYSNRLCNCDPEIKMVTIAGVRSI